MLVASGDGGTVSAEESAGQPWSQWPFIGLSSSWCSSTPWPSHPSTTTSQIGSLKYKVCILISCLLLPYCISTKYIITILLLQKIWYSSLFSRCSQQGSFGLIHSWDACEDVQFRATGLLRVAVQPLWLFCGVWRHRGDNPGGVSHHVSTGDLSFTLRTPPQNL